MPTPRKAARGKRRWVGLEIDTKNIDEDTLLEKLASDAMRPKLAWISEDSRFLIVEVRLENHRKLIDFIGSIDHAESITSSGKIRLVKSRIRQSLQSRDRNNIEVCD